MTEKTYTLEELRAAILSEREECAKIAENVYMHTASYTTERDAAQTLCPGIAMVIRDRRSFRNVENT